MPLNTYYNPDEGNEDFKKEYKKSSFPNMPRSISSPNKEVLKKLDEVIERLDKIETELNRMAGPKLINGVWR